MSGRQSVNSLNELIEHVGCSSSIHQIYLNILQSKRVMSVERKTTLVIFNSFQKRYAYFIAALSYSAQCCLFGYELMIEPQSAG